MTAKMARTIWVDLLGSSSKIVQGRYRTRIVEAGDKNNPALLLLHGTGGHLENYARNIAPLSERFRVIAMDFLWHGLSQPEGFDDLEVIPHLVDQVLDVLDMLGIEKIHIEGQSMGGWVAMRLALDYPQRVRRLILITPTGYMPDDRSVPGYAEPDGRVVLSSSLDVLRHPSYENVRSRMEKILANPSRLTDEAIFVRKKLYGNPEIAEVQQRFITEYLTGKNIRKYLVSDELARRIAQPTLVYWGDRNSSPPALGLRLSQQVGNGRFHCAVDCGHWAQFESADEHNRLVLDFLQEDA